MLTEKEIEDKIEEYKLPIAEHNRIYIEDIEAPALSESQAIRLEEEPPLAIVVGGTMGSGKTELTKIAEERFKARYPGKGRIKVDADALRAKHPKFEKLLAARDPNAGTYTHYDASGWVGKLLESVPKYFRNLLFDTSLRDAVWDANTFLDLKKKGYRVEVMLVAANKHTSKLGNAYRYENNINEDKLDRRLVPPKLHDYSYKALIATIKRLEEKKAADKIEIYNREGQLLFESTLNKDGSWTRKSYIDSPQHPPSTAADALVQIRNSPFTEAQHQKHMELANEASEWLENREVSPHEKENINNFLVYRKAVKLLEDLQELQSLSADHALINQKQQQLVQLVYKPPLSMRVMKVLVAIAVLNREINHAYRDEKKEFLESELNIKQIKLERLLKHLPNGTNKMSVDSAVEKLNSLLRDTDENLPVLELTQQTEQLARIHLATLLDSDNKREQVFHPFPQRIQDDLNHQLGLIPPEKLTEMLSAPSVPPAPLDNIPAETSPIEWNFEHLNLEIEHPDRIAQIQKLIAARDNNELSSRTVSSTEKESFNKSSMNRPACYLDIVDGSMRFATYNPVSPNAAPTLVEIPLAQQGQMPKAVRAAIGRGRLARDRINSGAISLQPGDTFPFSTSISLIKRMYKYRIPKNIVSTMAQFSLKKTISKIREKISGKRRGR